MDLLTEMDMLRVFLLSAALLFCVGYASFYKMNPDTRHIIDKEGRERIFHGVNVVYKKAPYHPILDHFDPQLSLCAEDMDNLAAWGFTVVRLYVAWEAVEFAPGAYNETYLAVLSDITKELGKRGIATIIDMHQDLLARRFCGEGVPEWVLPQVEPALPFAQPFTREPLPLNDQHIPAWEDCHNVTNFFGLYFADASAKSWQVLYEEGSSFQLAFIAFWRKVADHFKDDPNVLGYELLNEPFSGDIYGIPELLYPPEVSARFLMPLYQRLHKTIREVDDTHIIIFEPPVMALQFFESGFEEGPGGPAYNDRQLYAFHCYCSDINGTTVGNRDICDELDTQTFVLRQLDMDKMNLGGIMTEFGAVSNVSSAMVEVSTIADLADAHLISWAYWQFKYYDDVTTQAHMHGYSPESFYNQEGQLEEGKIQSLGRPHAQAVCGKIVFMGWFPHGLTADGQKGQIGAGGDGHFQLQMDIRTNCGGPTIIYTGGSRHFPQGAQVVVEPEVLRMTSVSSDIHLTFEPVAHVEENTRVTVTVWNGNPPQRRV